jgi:hypothetical protein
VFISISLKQSRETLQAFEERITRDEVMGVTS